MAVKKSALRTVYHVEDGPAAMYEVDARHALRFNKEWSETPWSGTGEKAIPIVEIPDDWQDLKSSERISLAVSLGAKRPGLTAAKADDVIAAEVERREHDSNEAPPAKMPDPAV
jgi:hypothetical protein